MRKIIVQILIVCTSLCAYAQIPTMPRSMLSPNAASLGEYGEVPVSPFTGIPQIEIPIYEIKVGDYTLPISMSYHAGGVRPDQHPGWTGLGWTLNAGGCISRVVNDEADDLYDPSDYFSGYYFSYDILNNTNWSSLNYLKSIAGSQLWYKDTQPDIFSFNFLGYNGKFFLNEKREWIVQCDNNIKVECSSFIPQPFNYRISSDSSDGTGTYTGYPSFKTFTITTEDGTQYIFGGTTEAIEYSIVFLDQASNKWNASSWYLTKIILPNGKEIGLEYEKREFINQLYPSYTNITTYGVTSIGGKKLECSYLYDQSNSLCINGQLISPRYLKKISFPYGSIDFKKKYSTELSFPVNVYSSLFREPNPSPIYYIPVLQYNHDNLSIFRILEQLKWYELYSINIKNNNGNLIKSFQLDYNNNPNQRLMLTQITECSDTNRVMIGRKYTFEYDSPALLPPYLDFKTDHWGFYNATKSNVNSSNYYTQKEPLASVLTYGVLNKINYPTGGYTRFEYEPHRYSKIVSKSRQFCDFLSENKLAGGLRIKKIISSPTGITEDEIISKEYLYVENYPQNKSLANISSGVLGGYISYSFSDYDIVANNDPNSKKILDIFSTQSVLPGCENSTGTHVGYSEVIERNPDGSFIQYRYTNFDNGHYDEPYLSTLQLRLTPYEPYSSKAQERGILTDISIYNSSWILKSKKHIEYEPNKTSSSYIPTMSVSAEEICPGKADVYYKGSTYKIYTYSMRKIKETEEIYENGTTPIKSVKTFAYNPNKLVSQITKTIGNNEILRTSYKYPDSYINQNSIYSTMVQRHRLSPIVEVNEERVYDEIFYPLVKTNFNYTTNIMKPSTITQSIKGNSSEVQQTYDYDIMGNPIYEVTSESNHTVYLWGYNYQYLVAIIKNATLNDVKKVIKNIDNFNASATPDFAKLDLLRYYLTEAQITTFQYRPLIGLTSKIDPNGIITYYEYDGLNRLKHIKDNNGCIIESYKYNFNN